MHIGHRLRLRFNFWHAYMMKKILTSPWTALLTLALILSIRIADPSFVESVRLRYFDTLITQKTPTANNIYTVNIDEAALDKYGSGHYRGQNMQKLLKIFMIVVLGLLCSMLSWLSLTALVVMVFSQRL